MSLAVVMRVRHRECRLATFTGSGVLRVWDCPAERVRRTLDNRRFHCGAEIFGPVPKRLVSFGARAPQKFAIGRSEEWNARSLCPEPLRALSADLHVPLPLGVARVARSQPFSDGKILTIMLKRFAEISLFFQQPANLFV